ncbi:protein of unknown function [Nitrosospira sp. Nl5]|uniref:GIY-YIG nuclease family protein n=1 Tax=Nitrosospira sp. Nl5 TaxID=200120 RepID=UPI000883599E|nr:GIY-YIG nuclease family protein [Nitrosospira sp. Nl5]SCY57570.1 protein of unknown function [Nitrosospira sp. Nl5]
MNHVTLGKSIQIYLADGSVTGIRHGEISNWTGQAIACPRARFPELREWSEAKRPGVYFLFGQNEESGQDAVYIGEAEIVLDRLSSHIKGTNGKEFWTELVIFTSKDDNLTKGHVRYLEARLVGLANAAGRHAIENSASPQLPALPRAARDAMEEFINGVRTLLGVLGHRVLEPLLVRTVETQHMATVATPLPMRNLPPPGTVGQDSSLRSQMFQLTVSNIIATAVRTDEGLVILANSEAAPIVQSSLSGSYRALRARLITSGVLVENGVKLKFARDQLFGSPSQAAAVVVGYSINGRDRWKTPSGTTYSDFEKGVAGSIDGNSLPLRLPTDL